ncbi:MULTISPECIES: LysR family transcriptional regulator ArgP [unclassified Ruegeria]|uniref:LysR family transcriptional regulator ArgP n=1 Tax=unclassified Ruegeria TaxID=2625375 RepID=UPI001ADC689A|nr:MULTISPECIES: LysR family transcriptional regulator ArgP [unclassified Ruegeria]MBO9411210.1 LysR family transcriptional regulator ArgP [Ruegeria sp. R8_1]MBO9415411.1 LysR family transcriptional regulator ArgP [Ruegeria sp. R8_2]
MLLDPNHLSALSAILRHGSFEAAASELSVTPSAISQRIKALEDRVGAALILRGTPCTATPAGLRIAQHAEDIGLLEAQLARELTLDQNTNPTRVRIAVPADVLATWFIDAMAQVDDMLFDLVIDDQDYSADWLKRGEVSAAVTIGGQPVAGCDAIALGSLRYLATASPAFMQRWFPKGVNIDSLGQAPNLTFNRKDGLQRAWITQQTGRRLSPPSHYLASSHGFVEAAIAGLGWGMNPEGLVKPALRDGSLSLLLADAPYDVPLTWQVGRILAPALRPLTQAVKRSASKALQPA